MTAIQEVEQAIANGLQAITASWEHRYGNGIRCPVQ